jgi:hypothetical protein
MGLPQASSGETGRTKIKQLEGNGKSQAVWIERQCRSSCEHRLVSLEVKPIMSWRLHEVQYEHDAIVVVSDFCNSGSGPEYNSVPGRFKPSKRATCWTKLYVGAARRPSGYKYDAGCDDVAACYCGTNARSRGAGSCRCGSITQSCDAAYRSRDDNTVPKHPAQAAKRKSPT